MTTAGPPDAVGAPPAVTDTASTALLAALEAAGLTPRPAPLLDQAGSPFLAGHAVTIGRTEIVVRHLDPATLLIVRVRRTETAPAPGLASPLQALACLVALLARTRPATGLERVVGLVDSSSFPIPRGLDDARLGAFYRRLHGATDLDPATIPGLPALDRRLAGKKGAAWVGLELARFRGERLRG